MRAPLDAGLFEFDERFGATLLLSLSDVLLLLDEGEEVFLLCSELCSCGMSFTTSMVCGWKCGTGIRRSSAFTL